MTSRVGLPFEKLYVDEMPLGTISMDLAVYVYKQIFNENPKFLNCLFIVHKKLSKFSSGRTLLYIQSWTTDAQRGKSLNCTAENSLPLPNF